MLEEASSHAGTAPPKPTLPNVGGPDKPAHNLSSWPLSTTGVIIRTDLREHPEAPHREEFAQPQALLHPPEAQGQPGDQDIDPWWNGGFY